MLELFVVTVCKIQSKIISWHGLDLCSGDMHCQFCSACLQGMRQAWACRVCGEAFLAAVKETLFVPLCLRLYNAGAPEPFWVSSYRLTHMAFSQELGLNLGVGRERSACSELGTHFHSQVLHSGWQGTLVIETTVHCSQTSP